MKIVELQHKIKIEKPTNEVFAFVTNPANVQKWRIGLIEHRRITPPPVGTGSKCTETVRILGKSFKSLQEITKFEQDSKRSLKIRLGPITIIMNENYLAQDSYTILSVKGSTKLKGIQQYFGSLIIKRMQKQLVEEMTNIKTQLEA